MSTCTNGQLCLVGHSKPPVTPDSGFMSNPSLSYPGESLEVPLQRGSVVRRRFQKGCFVKEKDGRFYSLFYADVDGKTKLVKRFIGHSRDLSERAARRQHALTMEKVNHDRGSAAPI